MNEKLNTRVEDRLLEARKESLKNLHSTSMRSHGKFWGMDVFSWVNPNPGLIANTIHSFPFPVIWVGNALDIMDTLTEEEMILGNLHSIIAFDSNVFTLKDSWLNGVNNCAGTNSVEDAFQFVKLFKASQTVLMFSSSGENCEQANSAFEELIKLYRGQ